MLGIPASTNRPPAAAIIDPEKRISRSNDRPSAFTEPMPPAMPIPKQVTRSGHPAAPPWRVVWANTGPSERTAPTAQKATTMPVVIVATSGVSRRNRTPSTMSRKTRRMSSLPGGSRRCAAGRIAIRLIMNAEKPNVPASSHRARDSGLLAKYGIATPSHLETPARTAATAPPSGSVP